MERARAGDDDDDLYDLYGRGDDDDDEEDEEEGSQQQQQQQPEEEEQEETPTIRILGQLDPGRMDLMDEELGWAKTLKAAVEEDDEIPNLSDFDYCQIVACEYDDVEGGLWRAQMLQHFRQEYDIGNDSVENGVAAIKEAMRIFPGFFLSFSFVMETYCGHYTLAVDLTKLKARLLSELDGVAARSVIKAMYFVFQSMNCDFEAARCGMAFLVECDNFHWKQHMTLDIHRHFLTELVEFFPTLYRKVRHYNTGLFLNVIMTMSRPFLPTSAKEMLEMGCTSPIGRLDRAFLQPTLEDANQRFLDKFAETMERRRKNVESFVLPSS